MAEQGGRERTILITLFVLLMLVTGPAIGAIGVIMPPLIHEFHWDRAQVSSLIFASVFTGGVLGPGVGWLIDWAGANLVMAAGFALLGVSYIGLSLANSLAMMFVLYCAFGLGVAMSGLMPAMVVAINWFGRRRGLGSGVAVLGFTLGLAAMPPIVTAIIAHGGWRVALRWLSIPCFVVGIPLSLSLIRTRPPVASAVDSAQEMALQPGLDVGPGLATMAFWQLLAVQFLFALGFGAVFLHIITFLIGVGFSASHAATIFSTQTLVSGVGVVVLGHVADRLNARRVLSVSMLVLAVGIAALLGTASARFGAPMVVLFVLGWGSTATSINTLLPILVAETLGVRRLGTFSGILLFAGSMAHAIGPLISGVLYDMSGRYTEPFLMAVGLVLLTGALTVTVRPAKGCDEIPLPAGRMAASAGGTEA